MISSATRASETRRGVVVTHPVHQHAYETAFGLQKAGLLHEFVTSFYFASGGGSNDGLLGLVPTPMRNVMMRRLGRRYHPGLDPSLVRSIPRVQGAVLAQRLPVLPRFVTALGSNGWVERVFDSSVARRILRADDVDFSAVHVFEGAGLETLKAARSRGRVAVLDVPSAHEHLRAALASEGQPTRHFDTKRIQEERKVADFLVVPSRLVFECLVDNGVAPDKIVTIPLGVDPVGFSPVRHPRAEETVRFLYVGVIAPHKGIRYLLEAWRRLRIRGAELVLVGPRGRNSDDLFATIGSTPTCRWVGQVGKREIDRWFKASDVLVLPTLSDSWGLVVGEALASGVPVITSEACGFPVRHGVDGLVVPPRDAGALAEAVSALFGSQATREMMGRSGRSGILENYTWDHYHRRVERLYDSILSGSAPPAFDGSGDRASDIGCYQSPGKPWSVEVQCDSAT